MGIIINLLLNMFIYIIISITTLVQSNFLGLLMQGKKVKEPNYRELTRTHLMFNTLFSFVTSKITLLFYVHIVFYYYNVR